MQAQHSLLQCQEVVLVELVVFGKEIADSAHEHSSLVETQAELGQHLERMHEEANEVLHEVGPQEDSR